MTNTMVEARHTASRPAWWAVAWWVVVGALVGFGVAALLTIGVALLVTGAVLAVVGAVTPALRGRAALAAVAGFAAVPLYLAWLNRGGPGDVCTASATASSCVQEWSPWPFLVVAVLLVAVGPVVSRLTRGV